MTFIIEATKGDQHTTDLRSSGIVAVILARKLAAEGFEVSIRSPSGRLFLAGQFNLLLTGEGLDSKEIANDR
jgi:DNA-binding MarR family transcriptional regulator